MIKAIRIHQQGGPEEMKWEEVKIQDPSEGEVLIRHEAVGLNFIDVYHRNGLYPLAEMPAIIGMEGAGVVEAVGVGVTDTQVGERVAYAGMPVGAYSEKRLIPEHRLISIPDSIDFKSAAAMMLQGLTVQYLIRRTFRVQAGMTILCQAAAGGVGLFLCQWAKALGATVIGTVSTPEKAELAKANGCDYPILYTEEDFHKRVMEITDGAGVPVVYDSIGKSTFDKSLDCLSPMGMMVSYGNASGPVPAFEPGILAQKGSLFLTRPSLMHYTAKREDLVMSASDLIEVVSSGAVKISVNQQYELKDAAQAHRDLEARKTTGSTILIP